MTSIVSMTMTISAKRKFIASGTAWSLFICTQSVNQLICRLQQTMQRELPICGTSITRICALFSYPHFSYKDEHPGILPITVSFSFLHIHMRFSLFTTTTLLTVATTVTTSTAQKLHQQPAFWSAQADLIRSAVEDHYSSMIDDVLSTHAEDLLLKLTHASRCQRRRLLQSQANALSSGTFSHGMYTHSLPQPLVAYITNLTLLHSLDACVARLPEYIGHHIHEQTRHVAQAVTPAVEESLIALWPEYHLVGALPTAQHQISSVLYSVNLAVGDQLHRTLDAFDILGRVRNDLETCQQSSTPVLQQRNSSILKLCFTNVRCMLRRLLAAGSTSDQDDGEHLLDTYSEAMKADLRSELEGRVGELVMTVFDDLYAEDDDEEF